MYNLVLVHGHIDGPHDIIDLLDLRGVVGHRHIPFFDIVELLTKL